MLRLMKKLHNYEYLKNRVGIIVFTIMIVIMFLIGGFAGFFGEVCEDN
jgi:hypothetical protein